MKVMDSLVRLLPGAKQTNNTILIYIYTGMPIVSLFSTPLFSGQSLRFVTCPGLACHIRADPISVYISFFPSSTVSPREQHRWDTIAVSSLSSAHTRRSLARVCLYDDSEHSTRVFSGKHGSSGRPVPSWSMRSLPVYPTFPTTHSRRRRRRRRPSWAVSAPAHILYAGQRATRPQISTRRRRGYCNGRCR